MHFCIHHGEPCRSVNFGNAPNVDTNCEFLADVDSERPDLLLKDEKYDYYVYLDPKWVSKNSQYVTVTMS